MDFKMLGYTYTWICQFFSIGNKYTEVLSHTSLDLFPHFSASFPPPFPTLGELCRHIILEAKEIFFI